MDKSPYISVPYISMQPNYLTIFHRPVSRESGLPYSFQRHELNRHNQTQGKISTHAKRRISKSFNWLVFYSEPQIQYIKSTRKTIRFRLNFITLTLSAPQKHSDLEIKKSMFNNFLTTCRTKYNLKDYIWKAERQKNGNIHFHIITNTFIHYQELQAEWNRCQETLGYITEFAKKNGHTNPPSTEIKAVKKLKKMQGYVAKYIMKNDTDKPISGRLWYASKSLLNLPKTTEIIDSVIDEEIERIICSEPVKEVHGEHSNTIFINFELMKKYKCKSLISLFSASIFSHFRENECQLPPPTARKLAEALAGGPGKHKGPGVYASVGL